MTSDGTAAYKYDVIGRVESVGTTLLGYDLYHNMTRYGTNDYRYDAYNQRFFESADGDTSYYLTSGPTVLHEYAEGDTTPVFEHYDDGRGLPATYEKDRGYLFYYKDHLGSTRRMSGTDMRRDYYPYGENRTVAGAGEPVYRKRA